MSLRLRDEFRSVIPDMKFCVLIGINDGSEKGEMLLLLRAERVETLGILLVHNNGKKTMILRNGN